MAKITGFAFVSCDDDGDDYYSISQVIRTWTGYEYDDSDYYKFDFYNDKTGEVSAYYDYDRTNTFDFKWKMTNNSKGKIHLYSDGYYDYYNEENLEFKIKNNKMTISVDYFEDSYTYSEIICILEKEKKNSL